MRPGRGGHAGRPRGNAFPAGGEAYGKAGGDEGEGDLSWSRLLSSWVELGLDPERFWRLTLREMKFIIDGAVAKLKRERRERITLAWNTAKLTVYAPQKSRDFVKLESLIAEKREAADARPHWKTVLAKVQAWATAKK
ncbi:phage tail assembly chaperone [Rhizobium laguerreae]|uniref:phage tail assembly chaperone n=1 Tax=Rhizobium laguerreae TaxID=1076926 RepID=UPI00315D2F6B